MRNYIATAIALFVFFMTPHLNAKNENRIKQDLINALSEENLKVIEAVGAMAEADTSNDELIKLMNELKEGLPGQPIAELMTVEQAVTFGTLTQKSKYGLAMQMMYSRRERDLRILKDFIILTSTEFEWGKEIKENTEDKVILGIIYAMDSSLGEKTEELDAFPFVNDNVDKQFVALIDSMKEYIDSYNTVAVQFRDNYTKRTGLSEYKDELLTAEEKKIQNTMRSVFNQSLKYAVRLCSLRCLYSAMTIDNKWRIEDVITTNGDMEKVGVRLGTEVNTKWSPTAKLVMGMSWFIAEKFPTTLSRELEIGLKGLDKK
jgi:hypothetical protein